MSLKLFLMVIIFLSGIRAMHSLMKDGSEDHALLTVFLFLFHAIIASWAMNLLLEM